MQISVAKTWEAAQEHLRSRLSADTYNLWFAPLRAHAQGDNSLVLEVPNDFCQVWLKDNYTGLLQEVVALASGRQLEIQFKVGNNSAAAPLAPLDDQTPAWAHASAFVRDLGLNALADRVAALAD